MTINPSTVWQIGPCFRHGNEIITSPPIGGGRGIVHAHVCLSVCLCVCVCVCLFVRVFAKFQCVISQPFLNRSLWNLAYILRMGTPWLTNIFRILGQRSSVVGRRKVKTRYLAISRERMVVEIRDWCQNVGECPNPPGGAAGEVCHLWLPCYQMLWCQHTCTLTVLLFQMDWQLLPEALGVINIGYRTCHNQNTQLECACWLIDAGIRIIIFPYGDDFLVTLTAPTNGEWWFDRNSYAVEWKT